ncbi:hypothetical protein WJX72_002028 [[Myrmecia] bisecta]|uniref:Uncharacterized protein n=1 Tax=[Myrmecia] bisecta TaxID=41462 RepID=A0AAW1PPL3_9CHLO
MLQYEVLLQEMLGAAGLLGKDSELPNEKRLACHHALLRELLVANAFGPLQASPAGRPAAVAERAALKEELVAQAAKHEAHVAELNAASAALQAQLDSTTAQVASLRQQMMDKTEQHWKANSACEAELRKWKERYEECEREANYLRGQLAEGVSKRAAMSALQEACKPSWGAHAGGATQNQAEVLQQQLGVLLNSRLDNFERQLAVTHADDAPQLRAACMAECNVALQQLRGLGDLSQQHASRRGVEQASPANLASPQTPAAAVVDGKQQQHRPSSREGRSALPADQTGDQAEPSGRSSGQAGAPAEELHAQLWRKFEHYCGLDFVPRPAYARRLDLKGLLRLIEDCLASKWRQSSAQGRGLQEATADFFFRYVEEKYGPRDLAAYICHGCLTAVEQHQEGNAVVRMFAAILRGTLAEPAWQYSMQWRRILARLAIGSLVSPKAVIATLYPTAAVEEQAALLAKLTHREGTHADDIIEVLTGELLSGRELRYQHWLQILQSREVEPGLPEFADLCMQHMPSVKREMIESMFRLVQGAEQRGDRHGSAPPDKLAYVAACLEAAAIDC